MTRPSPFWMLVRNDLRALWPVWAASAAVCGVVAVAGAPSLHTPARLAYFAGSVTLAALSVGHEYSHRTLPTLLSLPLARRRLLLAKLVTLVTMLAGLAAILQTIPFGAPFFGRGSVAGAASVLAGVALAPWLTMLCRSPLAGAVFAIGVTGGLHLAAMGALVAWFRLGGSAAWGMASLHNTFLLIMLAGGFGLGAIGTWRTFLSLEAIEGRDPDLHWPRWLRSRMVLDEAELVAPARRSHPAWLLLKKEIRIQQMAIVVAGINVLIWLLASTFVDVDRDTSDVLALLAILYGGMLAVLIGALASAEERHLGTLEWQTLLPIPAWQQFALKTVVALALSLLLAFALPLALSRGELAITPLHAMAVLLLTIGSLYVSSRCDSALTAVALAIPALLMTAAAVGWSISMTAASRDVALVVSAALVVLALRLAFVNHRSARA